MDPLALSISTSPLLVLFLTLPLGLIARLIWDERRAHAEVVRAKAPDNRGADRSTHAAKSRGL